MDRDHRRVIAHFVFPYLFRTGSWIYGQLTNIEKFKSIVFTNRKENLDIFPFEPLYSYEDLQWARKVFIRLRNRGFNDVFYNFFYGLLKTHKPVLMHCHFGTCGAEFLKVSKTLRMPMVTTFYGYDMSLQPRSQPEWVEKYRVLFEEGQYFLAEGTHMKKCLNDLGCPAEKLRVQHLGVDLDELPFLPRKIGEDGIVRILVAGNFREKKGIPYALEAFARVHEKYRHTQLTLIGGSTVYQRDEEEKHRIMEIIRNHAAKESIRWLGFKPHPMFREALKSHHLFLSPSVTARDGDSEGGSPVSITEAQATGMPVISTFHADIPEVVLHEKTGVLSPEREIDALEANLEWLVTHPECWEEMGLRGREHIEKEYNVEIQGRKLEEVYLDVLSPPPRCT